MQPFSGMDKMRVEMNLVERMKRLTPRRWIGMAAGNVILAIGVCILKWSGTGNDPYTGMNMALAAVIGLRFGIFQILINCFVFLIELFFGRKYIGPGTIVNWFLIGPLVDWFYPVLRHWFFGVPSSWGQQLVLAALGVIVISFACSVYQTADAGISPYDSLAIIGEERTPIPYFWCRMFCDGVCALVCFLAHGVVGIGMLLCAFALGPVIAFFNRFFSVPVLLGRKKEGTGNG